MKDNERIKTLTDEQIEEQADRWIQTRYEIDELDKEEIRENIPARWMWEWALKNAENMKEDDNPVLTILAEWKRINVDAYNEPHSMLIDQDELEKKIYILFVENGRNGLEVDLTFNQVIDAIRSCEDYYVPKDETYDDQ